MKRYWTVFLWLAIVLMTTAIWAQEADEENIFSEDDIFSDGESVVDLEDTIDETVTEQIESESVTFSGEISANFGFDITRAYLDGDDDFEDNPYSTSVDGDFLLDVRLREGIKSFANLGLRYTPQGNEFDKSDDHLDTVLKEFFVDVNIARRVYLRGGKQNLKWGRGYFWNPTDLISEDRKDFIDMNARLEGVYGLKMHVPFGTKYNIYGFINTSGANKTNEFSYAGKLEVLLPKDVEMALSAWGKDEYKPVFGLDFATYKFNMDWRGELGLSYGDNRHRLGIEETPNGEKRYTDKEVIDEWVSRICLGFTRSFDFRNVNDRISLTGEFYYNHGGYAQDMLKDQEVRDEFLQGGYFEPGNYGKYYAAIFSSLSKFIVSDMSFKLNAIGNLSDSSFILSSGVNYELANNAWLRCDIRGHFGRKNREYTLDGTALSTEVSVSVMF